MSAPFVSSQVTAGAASTRTLARATIDRLTFGTPERDSDALLVLAPLVRSGAVKMRVSRVGGELLLDIQEASRSRVAMEGLE